MSSATASRHAVGSRMLGSRRRVGDRAFATAAFAAGALVILVLGAVTVFLLAQSLPALTAGRGQLPGNAPSFWAYVAPLAFGTVWASALALALATPISVGVALFISHYAPRRLAAVLGYTVDLLAAVPSVVFGLWGVNVLAPRIQPLYAWLSAAFGWFPPFAGPVSATGKTVLTAAIVLAVMILPLMTAICREAFLRTPRGCEEAALALGATRWELVRMAVLPHARTAIVSGAMLGLGRALGETMAVAMVLSPALVVNVFLLTSVNPNTIASNIALQFPESFGVQLSALIASGLVLFAITFAVNALARLVVRRPRASVGGAR